ncbi:globin [Alicyclobacillus ferrooxydans]|uniref:Globin n=1 Tax=Alicyclobacillus ferrooxydans TaxID=471514 RepID=A0A0P9CI63_9BACL|nr:globin [Alicyclobacillus ferrooxydans]KPV45136.1 globin [Alicyclobacillus ferrooxydans]
MEQKTVYEMIGGADTIGDLVDAFYARVGAHPGLIPLFPEDLTPVRNRQFKFLTQLFGGPRLYSDLYGAPMLRAKHLPHPITPQRAVEWLECMRGAMDEIGLQGPVRDFMYERLQQTAYHMVNSED